MQVVSYFSNIDEAEAIIIEVADTVILTLSENKDDGLWYNPSSFSNTGTNMTLGYFNSNQRHAYFTFDSLSIDLSNKVIDSMFIWITTSVNGSINGIHWNIKMWDTSDVQSPISYAQAQSFSRTSNTVNWSPTGTWQSTIPQKSPDLKSLLNELITSYGSSLKRLGVLFISNTSSISKTMCSMEGSSTYKAFGKIYYRNLISKINTDIVEMVPSNYFLLGNYPNPFNPSTMINYSLPYQSAVELKIYDLMGGEVKSFNIPSQSPGYQNIFWDGRNENGTNVSSGIYLYRISIKSLENSEVFIKTAKMVLLK